MSVRNYPGGATLGRGTAVANASGATTGDKLSYFPQPGTQSVVRFASVFVTAGAATIVFKTIQGGITTVLQQTTVSAQFAGPVFLNPGDSFRVSVTVLDAASTFDINVECEEFPAT